MRSSGLHRVLLAAAFLLVAASGANADWIREFRAEGLYNSNVSRSNREEDRLDDFAFGASVRFGKFTHLDSADRLRLTFTLDVDSQAFAEFDDFSNISAGATASLRYRFGLGAMAPFLRVEGGVRWTDFNDELQDGVRSDLTVVVGKRIFERLELEAGYVFDHTETRTSLYDQQGNGLFVRVAFDLTSSTQLTAEYSFRDGEVVSYNVPPRPDLIALANTRLEVNNFGTLYVAYNLDATTHRAVFGIHQAITRNVGVSFRYELQNTDRSQIDYLSHVFLAAIQISL
jgi:hypothetical protein